MRRSVAHPGAPSLAWRRDAGVCACTRLSTTNNYSNGAATTINSVAVAAARSASRRISNAHPHTGARPMRPAAARTAHARRPPGPDLRFRIAIAAYPLVLLATGISYCYGSHLKNAARASSSLSAAAAAAASSDSPAWIPPDAAQRPASGSGRHPDAGILLASNPIATNPHHPLLYHRASRIMPIAPSPESLVINLREKLSGGLGPQSVMAAYLSVSQTPTALQLVSAADFVNVFKAAASLNITSHACSNPLSKQSFPSINDRKLTVISWFKLIAQDIIRTKGNFTLEQRLDLIARIRSVVADVSMPSTTLPIKSQNDPIPTQTDSIAKKASSPGAAAATAVAVPNTDAVVNVDPLQEAFSALSIGDIESAQTIILKFLHQSTQTNNIHELIKKLFSGLLDPKHKILHLTTNRFLSGLACAVLLERGFANEASALSTALTGRSLSLRCQAHLTWSLIANAYDPAGSRECSVAKHMLDQWKNAHVRIDRPRGGRMDHNIHRSNMLILLGALLDISSNNMLEHIENISMRSIDFNLRKLLARSLLMHAARRADITSIVGIMRRTRRRLSRPFMRYECSDVIKALRSSAYPDLVQLFPNIAHEAGWMFKDSHHQDLMYALVNSGEFRIALQVYTRFMSKTGVCDHTQGLIMVAAAAIYARMHDVASIEKVLKESIERKISRVQWVVSYLIMTIINVNGLCVAQERLMKLIKSGTPVALPTMMLLVDRFMKANHIQAAQHMLECARELNPDFSIIECTISMQLFITAGSVKDIKNLLEWMQKQRILPDARFIKLLARWFVETNNNESCMVLWKLVHSGVIAPTRNILNPLLKWTCVKDSVDLAMEIWTFGSLRNLFWSPEVSRVLANLCARHDRVDAQERVRLYQIEVSFLERQWYYSRP